MEEWDVSQLKEIGTRIYTARTAKGISLRDIASSLETDHSWLWKIEAGEVDLRISTLYRIAIVLEVNVHSLLPKSK